MARADFESIKNVYICHLNQIQILNMKKLLVIALGACLIGASTNAQVMKQSGGEKNFQVLFAPLGGNPVSIGGIAFRKFNATGDAAWRVNFFFGLNNETEITGQADTGSFSNGGGKPELEKNTSTMTFSIRPGYEKHFAGTDRLSPYVGAELLFAMTSVTETEDNLVDNRTSSSSPTDWAVLETEKKGDGGNTTFGLNLIAGFDYYIAKSLSLGAEFGFGFSTTSNADIESESVDLKDGSWTVVEDPTESQGSSMNVGPNVVAQLKLGWLF